MKRTRKIKFSKRNVYLKGQGLNAEFATVADDALTKFTIDKAIMYNCKVKKFHFSDFGPCTIKMIAEKSDFLHFVSALTDTFTQYLEDFKF